MANFNLTNDEIIYMYLHFDNYIQALGSDLEKSLAYLKGELELIEKTYGDEADFDKEGHNMYKQLMTIDVPNMIQERKTRINSIREKLKDTFDLINEADPEAVQRVQANMIDEPENISKAKDILKEKGYGFDN